MAEVAVKVVIDKLIPFLSGEIKLWKAIHTEVADIKNELEYIKAFLKDADRRAEKEDCNHLEKVWVKDVQEVAQCIEDVMLEYTFRVAQHEQRGGFLQKGVHLFKNLKHRPKITSEIQRIKTSLCNIKERSKAYNFREQGSSSDTKDVTWDDSRLDALFIGEAGVVGIDDSRGKLIAWLVEGDMSQLMVIAVVGMGGLGKTTLVKKVFDNHRVREDFDCCIWITVSQSYNREELLIDMINQYNKAMGYPELKEIHKFNLVELIDKLRVCLQYKRFVIVFDDIWNVEFWGFIKHVFPDDNKGSRIIATTRNYDVASSCKMFSIVQIYEMQPLPPEKAMELFCKKLFKSSNLEGRCPPELKELSVDIVARCKGLPLAIVSIGGLLSTKEMVVPEWESFRDSLSSELENNPHLKSIRKILAFSYHDLPWYLKSCFLYLAIYPEDYHISCSRLIRYWIIEGYVKEENGKTVEEVAKKYLSELIHRSLIQVSLVSDDGNVKRFQIHDLMREIILSKAAELNICQVLRKEDSSFYGKSRCLSIHSYSADVLKSNEKSHFWDHHSHGNMPNVLPRYRYPISIHSFLTEEGVQPGKFMGNYLHQGIASGQFLRLQTLDLERVFRPQLPKNIGNLIHLMYLGLRRTYLEDLPPSIGNLLNLQTLDLQHTYVNLLIGSILKLQKLKHLYLSGFRGILHNKGDILPKNLQTLRGLFVNDSPRKNRLDKLLNLRELKMTLQLNTSQQQNEVAEYVVKLKHLQFLDLRSVGEMDEPNELRLEPLLGLENLSRLYLSGMIYNPSIIVNTNGLPQKLTCLTLSASRLSDDPMPVLQKLLNLRSLSFFRNSYTGQCMVCSKGGFPQLLFLKFWWLEELEEWNVEEEAMQKLKGLQIRSCKRLKVFTGFENFKTLSQLEIEDISEELMATFEEMANGLG